MQLPQSTVLLREYHDSIFAALNAPEVPVYLDTSVLMWCLKVGKEARELFLGWCQDSLSGRLHIPTWAAHELYRHVGESTVLNNASQEVESYKNAVRDLLKYVCVIADDSLGTRPKVDLVRETREHAVGLDKTLTEISKHRKERYQEAVESLSTFVNDRIIQSNVFSVLQIIGETYSTRFSGRIPPGFKDESKKENSFGDLVMWREIIEHLKETKATAAVIVTNDNKSDWSRKPLTLIGYDGKQKGEQTNAGVEARIPHPMLQHEAKLDGINELIIISIGILSVVLDRSNTSKFGALTATTHPLGISKNEIGMNWRIIDPGRAPEPTTGRSGGEGQAIDNFDALTSDDLAAEVTLPETISPLLTSLNAPLEERASALTALFQPELLEDCSINVLIEIGRHLYRAALELPNEADAFISEPFSSESTKKQELANAIALGMFRELYFDETFRLRTTPFGGVAESLFSLLGDERLNPAIKKIGSLLAPFKDKLLYIPSAEKETFELKFRVSFPEGSKAKFLDSATLNGRELLFQAEPNGVNSLSHLAGDDSGTFQEIVSVIGRRFVIPFELLSIDNEPTAKITWDKFKGVGVFRTDLGGVVDEMTAAFAKEK